MTMEKPKVYICTRCGAETPWDEDLGPEVLCSKCWDDRSGVDNERAASQRRYNQEHKEELAAYKRRYYQEHKERGGKN
jgi:DNA-directed RNA polymerase subunit RPC12/RpoP